MHCRRDIHRRTQIAESKMMYFMGFLEAEIVSQECGWNLLALWLRSYFFQQKSSFLASQFHFWAVNMSKLFGMHTTLYWLRGMHCWWRHTVNIVRRDETLMNLSKCREKLTGRNWLVLDYSELLFICQWAASGWLAFAFKCMWWTVSEVIILLTNKLCLVDACLLERHGTFVDPSKHPCLYGR